MKPIMLVGATGVTGSAVAQLIRTRHPHVPLVLTSRRLERGQALANSLGNATAISLDLADPKLQLEHANFSCIAVFVKDQGLALMDFAGVNAIPYLSISSGHFESGPDFAHGLAASKRAPIVLASHWFCGAATIPALDLARQLAVVDLLEVGVLVDSADTKSGPATVDDFERISAIGPNTLYRHGGLYAWASPTQTVSFARADNALVDGTVSVSFDILSLGAATRAREVNVLQHFGPSSSRAAGHEARDEICIRAAGTVSSGERKKLRRTITLPRKNFGFTTFTATALIEHISAIERRAISAGLYMPEDILDATVYLESLKSAGATISDSECAGASG